jgi:hypothetical protein
VALNSLSFSTLAALVLMMFVDMATANPKAFVDHLPLLKDLAEQQPMYFVQVIQKKNKKNKNHIHNQLSQ